MLIELRVPRFKSVRDGVLPLHDLTLLVGRNGSGKSNVLEALEVLARIAGGDDLREVLDGGAGAPLVRGGAIACAPHGSDLFALGCTVATERGHVHLDVEVQVAPVVAVRSERLRVSRAEGDAADDGEPAEHTLLEASGLTGADGRDATPTIQVQLADVATGARLRLPATRLVSPQVATRVPTDDASLRTVSAAAGHVLDALRSVFVLEPAPRAMRRFVPAHDDRLRRDATNLSAALARLLDHRETHDRILEVLRSISETPVLSLGTATSELGDVMVTFSQRLAGTESLVPARLMSDGTLRLLAMLTALLDDDPSRGSSTADDEGASRTVVIEEIENGLHPSQAAALLGAARTGRDERRVRVIASTHSPALLDALPGDDHRGVVVCVRDDDGWTRLHRLVDMPNYFNVVAAGSLGRAATTDQLRPRTAAQLTDDLLDRVLGPREP